MSLTANDLIVELNQRLGPFAGLVNLRSAAAWSLREMGHTPASATTVTDADLMVVLDDDLNEFFDFVQYAAAERITDNLDEVQLRAISVNDDVDVVRRSWDRRTENLRKKIEKKYGYGLPRLSTGEINLLFESGNFGGEHE